MVNNKTFQIFPYKFVIASCALATTSRMLLTSAKVLPHGSYYSNSFSESEFKEVSDDIHSDRFLKAALSGSGLSRSKINYNGDEEIEEGNSDSTYIAD